MKNLIEDYEKAEVKKGELLLEQLEQERSELERNISMMEELSEIQNHIHFIEVIPVWLPPGLQCFHGSLMT